MVQSNENMSKIFDKGNARSKQKIALSFLGKIIKDHKIHILDAFAKEGILLDKNISDKRLIFEIKKTLMQNNQQAKNLKTSLAILILAKKDNFSDFFSYESTGANPSKVFRELITKDKAGVVNVFNTLNIRLIQNFSTDDLIRKIKYYFFGRFILPKKRKIQKLFRIKIKELLIANGINEDSNFSDFFNLSKNKTKVVKPPKVKAPKTAKEPKVKDGNFFTRLFKKDEKTGTSKAGDFYRNNKEGIDLLGSTILTGIAQRGSKDVIDAGINNEVIGNNINKEPEKTPYLKYALIVGGIAVAGFIVYKIVKRNK
jgi:hypothetical protein